MDEVSKKENVDVIEAAPYLEELEISKSSEGARSASFEQAILPHLQTAHRLAHSLTRRDSDAEDLVQESCLRAFKSFHSFNGNNGLTWLLAIVRNTFYSWWRQNRSNDLYTVFDEEIHSTDRDSFNPETLLVRSSESRWVLEKLPLEFRKMLVLRELDGLSYKEIAEVAGLPMGTVMSRLARARKRLQLGIKYGGNESIH